MSDYIFKTIWVVEATREEVYQTLEEVEKLVNWWPDVYLRVDILEKGQPGGVGKVVDLFTKGWLPYTLKWKFRVTETHFPTGFSLEAWGDFVGSGVWTFRQKSPTQCEIIYDWKITAEKPLLKWFSWLLKPVFSANHHWAMRIGEKSLQRELIRRREEAENFFDPA